MKLKNISILFQFSRGIQRSGIFICFIIFVSTFTSCQNPEDNYNKNSDQGVSSAKNIYDVTVTLPKGDGVELVESNCPICHSLRYIEMQPFLSEKSWEKTVHKMIKNFGAPIHDSMVERKIVTYLSTMKKQTAK